MSEQLLTQIAVVDLVGCPPEPSPDTAARLDAALSETGFAVVVNHGVDPALTSAMDAVSRRFFAQPLEAKTMWSAAPESRFAGFCSIGGGAPEGAEPVELWESFEVNRFDSSSDVADAGYDASFAARFTSNLWPAQPVGFRRVWEEYFGAMTGLVTHLFALAELAVGAEAGSMRATMDRHWSYLCANWYPAQDSLAQPGQMRQIPHTDIAAFTVLYQDDAPGTLEVLTAESSWTQVPRVPGSLVVNVGDLLSRWTNGRWPATWHRVGASASALGHERLSIPFFTYPDADTLVAPLKTLGPPSFEPVLVKEYVAARQSGAYRPEVPQALGASG